MSGLSLISGNTKILRGINRAMILNIIRGKQPISRINIARLTGLNKSTVSSIISELLHEDLIYELEDEDQNIGRNPYNLYLKLDRYFIGAINIDSTITRFAIVDIDGSVKGISAIETYPEDPEKFIDVCTEELKKLSVHLGIKHLEGLGVSIAGIVDSDKLTVNFAPNLGWEYFEIGELLKKKFPDVKNIAVENDAKSSALAELRFGSHNIDLSNFVFISVGQGIGSGIVVENQIMKGEFHASGEFGHMVIFEGGQLCSCGNNGCWEAYASEKAVAKFYNERIKQENSNSGDFLAQDVIGFAKKNDETAVQVIKKIGTNLGLGIANIVKAIDPHAIIIDGKITQVWDIIFPEMNAVIMQRTFFGKKKDIKILPSSVKILHPRLMGAAAIAIEEIFGGYKIMY